MSDTFETILLDVDADDHVATITLNRPDALNAFNRTMCEEMARAWRIVKLDDSVNAVVLRAAGSRAFSAGLDVKTSYGQPDNVWNHEDPGEALSPKWQKMWKPVVCAVQGMCTAGAFYFVNEADVVICSDDATFFDSHVSAGLVCALEPIGLMRRVGLGETLRIALMGNDERVGAGTALRIGLVTEVVPQDQLWARAHHIATAIAAKPPSATQGTVKAIWEAFGVHCAAAARDFTVPVELIVATIATESSGKPDAVRKEAKDTSYGLMQTLLMTAREALGDERLSGQDLLRADRHLEVLATPTPTQRRAFELIDSPIPITLT